jgi:hypothetical protein
MAVSDVSTAHQNAIGPLGQGIDHQIRMGHSESHSSLCRLTDQAIDDKQGMKKIPIL